MPCGPTKKILKKETAANNRTLYTSEDAQICMRYFSGYNYDRWFHIAPNVQVYFADAAIYWAAHR